MVNRVIILGRVGKDVEEPRYTGGGAAVVNLSIATNEKWTDKGGTKQDRTTWHKVVVWNNQAVACKTFLKKGQLVYIEGKLQTRQYDDKENKARFVTEIVATDIKFLNQKDEPISTPTFVEEDLPF
jgi:single-strand DNA-binding protein